MLQDDLFAEIATMPAIDVHSHLSRDQMAADSLDGVLFYHMVMYPLRAAGVPEEKLWPRRAHGLPPNTKAGRETRPSRPRDEWVRHFPAIAQTGFGRMVRMILRDLYDWDEPLTMEAMPRLEARFQERAGQPDWPQHVLEKANVVRVCSSQLNVQPLQPGQWDGGIRFTLEATPGSGSREMRSWQPRMKALGEYIGRDVTTRQAMYDAVAAFYDKAHWNGKDVLVAWVSSQADFLPVEASAIDELLAGIADGREPTPQEACTIEGDFIRAICEANRARARVFQICYGVQFLTDGANHSICRTASQFASSMGALIGEYPHMQFNILSGVEADEQTWCSLCLAYNNVSLSSYWWMTFYPAVMRSGWEHRFDMVPLSNLCAFFSDGYCVDYIYGRLMLTKRVLSQVLAAKVERDGWTTDEALAAARAVLFDTPRRLFLPAEQIDV